jgi:hypothetical protein
MPNLFVCAWAGLGVASLSIARRAVRVALLAVVALQLVLTLPVSGRREEWTVRNYAASMLSSFPPNALVLTRGDLNHNALAYVQDGEGLRPDVVALDLELMTQPWFATRQSRRHPDVIFPGDRYDPRDPSGYSLRQFLEANRSRPIHLCGGLKPGDNSAREAFESWPIGFCERVVPLGEGPPIEAWLAESLAELPPPSLLSRPSYPSGRWEAGVVRDLWRVRRRRAEFVLDLAIARGDDPSLLATAAASFEKLADAEPGPTPSVFKNLGIALARLASTEPSRVPAMIDAWERYLVLAPPDDPDVPRIRAVLDRARGSRGR